MEYNDTKEFDGICEMDGVYVNHYIRPKNNIENRVDRRKIYNPNKRVVISLRQRAEELKRGAVATKTFILKSENGLDIAKIATKHIKRGAVIHTDEATGYDDLHAHYDMKGRML